MAEDGRRRDPAEATLGVIADGPRWGYFRSAGPPNRSTRARRAGLTRFPAKQTLTAQLPAREGSRRRGGSIAGVVVAWGAAERPDHGEAEVIGAGKEGGGGAGDLRGYAGLGLWVLGCRGCSL
jgi:hypothetical protein